MSGQANGAMLPGIHHVTAITGDVQRNVSFYTRTLGLRLVKVTVNYDDPTSYHLYYGDRVGTPGTIMTFFGWPGAYRARTGTGQVSATAFAADPSALEFWEARLTGAGVRVNAVERFGERVLRLNDPDGMVLEIVATADSNADATWTGGGDVPADKALRGFHSVTLDESARSATEDLLVGQLGFERLGAEGERTRFRATGGTGFASLVDVLERPGVPRGRDGVGQVHHVAFRTPDDAAQQQWQRAVAGAGLGVSPVMDRDYFRSIYFREPGGVLFEIATDGLGFTVNEPAESLGTRLMLPAGVEPMRAELERVLPPLAGLSK